ncbi:MAG: hypothetical protein KF688_17005 [Pirellulales bacterium]|nr:hypothetical protein [Pirellulales bacterium]
MKAAYTFSRRLSLSGLAGVAAAWSILAGAGARWAFAADPAPSAAAAQTAAALAELQTWLGDDDNGRRWNAYLHNDRLGELLADPADAPAADAGRVLARYHADRPGLAGPKFQAVRSALDQWHRELRTAQSQSGRLADVAAAAAGDYRTVSRQEFEAARGELRARAGQLHERLGSGSPQTESWNKYLRWDLLAPQLAGDDLPDRRALADLALVSDRLYANHPGLELKEFRRLRQSLDRYRAVAAWHVAGKQRDPAADYARLIGQLGRQLERLSDKRTSETPWLASRVLGVVDELGDSPELVATVRRELAQPNLYAIVSGEFVNRVPRPPVDTVRPVRQTILGTRIYGTSRTLGGVRLQPVPWDDAIALVAQFEGDAYADTNGYNGPVKIRSTSTTALAAVKRVHFSDAGFVTGAAVSDADTRSKIHAINKTGGQFAHKLIEKVAWKRAGQQKRQSEMIGARNAANQLRENFDEELAAAVAEGRARYEEKVRIPLVRQGFFPEVLRMSSTAEDLRIVAALARRNQLGADGPPPAASRSRDLSVRLHESAVDNYLAVAMAGVRLSQDAEDAPLKIAGDAPPWLKEAAAKPPRAKQNNVGAEDAPVLHPPAGTPPFKPWSMRLNAEAPIGVTFDDDLLTVRLRAARLASDEDEYKDWDILVRYRPQRRGNRIVLVRTGDIEALPTGFDPAWDTRMAGRDSAFRNTLAKNMTARAEAGQGFPGEIDVPPIRIEGLGELRLADFLCDDHWLTLGWQLP